MHQAYKLKNKPVILDIDLLSEQIGMGYFETSGFKNNDITTTLSLQYKWHFASGTL